MGGGGEGGGNITSMAKCVLLCVEENVFQGTEGKCGLCQDDWKKFMEVFPTEKNL